MPGVVTGPPRTKSPASPAPYSTTNGQSSPYYTSAQQQQAAPAVGPPAMYQDPNTGNVFQWDPAAINGTNAGWRPFSSGQQGLAMQQQQQQLLNASSGQPKGSFDPYAAYAQASKTINSPSLARVAPLADSDRTAAEAAAFGRAKDRIGQATLGLLKSIRNQFASRGISGPGSGLEGAAIATGMTGQAGQLGDVIRDQAIEGLKRQYQITDTNYQGAIQQRAQDAAAEQQRQDSILALVRLAQQGAY